MIITGLGYAADAVIVALAPGSAVVLSEFTFVCEVVLLIWLIARGGRADRREKTASL